MLVIILMGAPGSGKGSNASLLSKRLNISHLSTGDILRKEVNDKTLLGLEIEKLLQEGRLVSDDLMLELIEKNINSESCKKGFILDGYPRNISQAKSLDNILDKFNINEYIVVELVVDKDTLIKRILGRFICAKCGAIYNDYFYLPKIKNVCDICKSTKFIKRNDDTENVIKHRLIEYMDVTLPVLEYYKEKNKYHSIDGKLNKELIYDKFMKLLSKV